MASLRNPDWTHGELRQSCESSPARSYHTMLLYRKDNEGKIQTVEIESVRIDRIFAVKTWTLAPQSKTAATPVMAMEPVYTPSQDQSGE